MKEYYNFVMKIIGYQEIQNIIKKNKIWQNGY